MYFRLKTLLKVIGFLLAVTGAAMYPAMLCALWYDLPVLARAFAFTGTASLIIGLMLYRLLPPSGKGLRARDGYLAVTLGWLLCALLGAIPFFVSGEVSGFTSALFESLAGYTTTGATVTPHRFSMPLLLWKATIHWLGGMGILVFIIAVLPAMGIGGQRIASAETPGAGLSRMSPRVQEMTKYLYTTYLWMTLAEFFLLWIGSDMNGYEAAVNTLGSISSAGLFLHPDGISYYHSLFVELVISCFSILTSINFLVYIYILRRNFETLRDNIEVRAYLIVIGAATLVVTASLWLSGTFPTVSSALRHGFFQVVSFASTSGFSIDDYSGWPALCQAVFFLLMFVGGCSGSTAGSLKVIRVLIVFRIIARGFYKRIHPRSLRAIKLGSTSVPAPMVTAVTSFTLIYGVTFFIGSLILSLQGLDLETTMSTAISMLSNTGIALGAIGSSGCFAVFSAPLQLVMCFMMLIGRLELITVFLLFAPSFWNPDRVQTR